MRIYCGLEERRFRQTEFRRLPGNKVVHERGRDHFADTGAWVDDLPPVPAVPAPDDAGTEIGRLDKKATWLAGGFATVATILTALGAVNGGMERMLRNYRIASFVAFGLIAGAIAIAVVALVANVRAPTERRLLTAGALAFSVGLVVAVATAAETPSTRERPRVTASLTMQGGLAVQTTVKAQGVRASENVFVSVDGLVPRASGGFSATRLYRSVNGPDGSGAIDLSFSVPIPAGRFTHVGVSAGEGEQVARSCDQRNLLEGCTIIEIPQASFRPSLSVTWDDTSAATVHVGVQGMYPARPVLLDVVALGDRMPRRLYRGFLVPDLTGGISDAPLVHVDPKFRRICAVAVVQAPQSAGTRVLTPSRLKCPTSLSDPDTNWTMTAVP
jgi:hypothetical protein